MSEEKRRPGPLIVIGGHEDRNPRGDRKILREVARHVRGGKLVLATVASHQPEGYYEEYRKAFADLKIGEMVEVYVAERSETHAAETLAKLEGAAGVFFSGGDQLRITSQIGDTQVEDRIRQIWESGGVIAGTSAGASVMSETMLVKGTSAETHRIGDLHMAPGLGLIPDVIIDQHFAERGRFGRLLGAVAHNPRVLGIGIDEDTAAIVTGDTFTVIGSGAVYVVDGEDVTHSNVAEASPERVLSMHGVCVHVLAAGDGFELSKRQPVPARAD